MKQLFIIILKDRVDCHSVRGPNNLGLQVPTTDQFFKIFVFLSGAISQIILSCRYVIILIRSLSCLIMIKWFFYFICQAYLAESSHHFNGSSPANGKKKCWRMWKWQGQRRTDGGRTEVIFLKSCFHFYPQNLNGRQVKSIFGCLVVFAEKKLASGPNTK